MLSNLLPGIREVRAPLAAGYLWLLAAWLVWGDHLLTAEDIRGLPTTLDGLGLAVAVSTTAYLLGSMIEGLARTARLTGMSHWKLFRSNVKDARKTSDHASWPRALLRAVRYSVAFIYVDRLAGSEPDDYLFPITFVLRYHEAHVKAIEERRFSKSAAEALEQWAQEQVRFLEQEERSGAPGSVALDAVSTRRIAKGLYDSVILGYDDLKTHLLRHVPDLHNEVDRQDQEAAFRSALVAPLVVLLCLLSINDAALWALGVVPILVLRAQARSLQLEAGNKMVSALRATHDLTFGGLLEARAAVRAALEPAKLAA